MDTVTIERLAILVCSTEHLPSITFGLFLPGHLWRCLFSGATEGLSAPFHAVRAYPRSCCRTASVRRPCAEKWHKHARRITQPLLGRQQERPEKEAKRQEALATLAIKTSQEAVKLITSKPNGKRVFLKPIGIISGGLRGGPLCQHRKEFTERKMVDEKRFIRKDASEAYKQAGKKCRTLRAYWATVL